VKDFKGRVAVVTGAASGIGRAMAEAFVAAGMKVVLSDIEATALNDTTASMRASGGDDIYAVVTDVSKPEQVDELAAKTLKKYGAVHILCNNAGVFIGGGVSWTKSLNDWRWIVGVNLLGVVHGIRSFLPIMIQQDSEAHIVNSGSLGGLIATPGSTLYGTTKFAVAGLTENVYLELQRGGFKPKMSLLCAGLVDTNLLNSRRNRPAEFTDEALPLDRAAQELRERAAQGLKSRGLSPRAVAEKVLDAIREERFYIFHSSRAQSGHRTTHDRHLERQQSGCATIRNINAKAESG
jgi:NAD(P)-dependent dehydrogenase (short-subunit alcohol dehydrogenase family)